MNDFNALERQVNLQANDEQNSAIFSAGGAILSAGAGSGKTFVLVRHLLIKVEKIISSNIHSPNDEIVNLVRKYFSETVLMTFTKKAAGEIQIRVRSTIENFITKDLTDEKIIKIWNDVLDIVDGLNITTIHGFCYKLVSKGLIPQVKSDFEIAEDWQCQKKIEEILSKWVTLNISEVNLKKTVLESYIHLNIAKNVLTSIFSDPLLHFEWFSKLNSDLVIDDSAYNDIYEKFLEIFKIKNLKLSLQLALPDFSSIPAAKKPPAWITHFLGFQRQLEKENLGFLDFFKSWDVLFNSISRLTIPQKNGENLEKLFREIREFREIFKDVKDSFLNFETDLELQNYWLDLHRQIFRYCEVQYYQDNMLTFSDLEYLVCKAVELPSTANTLSEYYKYFIIDEFQDTSEIQFLIVQKIIQNNPARLYVVGDVKQAIYGFRGGELEVFEKTSNMLSTKLSLVTNYRSDEKIINFNNRLFAFLFAKDHAAPLYLDQKSSPEKSSKGVVQKNILKIKDVESIKDLSTDDVESIEAQGILIRVEEIIKNDEVSVLYSRLRPSLKLIKLLMEKNIAFSAQVKISSRERPIYGILNYFLKYLINTKNRKLKNDINTDDLVDEFTIYIFIYSNLISGDDVKHNLKEKILKSYNNFEIMGAFEAFRILVLELGIYSIKMPSELLQIKRYFTSFNNNLHSVYSFLERKMRELENVQFVWGTVSPKVKIMTVHASKGLEFKNVILGGTNTNGYKSKSVDDLGSNLFSFKYKYGHESQKRKTPWYHYEKIISDNKDLAESVRLFYVACTRAISGLDWFSVIDNSGDSFSNAYSWNSYLESYTDHSPYEDEIKIKSSNFNLSSLGSNAEEVPLIYYSDLGYQFKDNMKSSSIGMISEISVTKFSTLEECPHKFYLNNILKLDEIENDCEDDPEDIKLNVFDGPIIETRSNAHRGSETHLAINNYFQTQNKFELEKLLSPKKLEWLLFQLGDIEKCYPGIEIKFESEIEFKFSLFSQMVSAIPDLIIKDAQTNEVLEIVDFKTGKDRLETRGKYWTQLYSYAYGQYKLGNISDAKKINLRLIYLDEMNSCKNLLGRYEIDTKLFKTWQKLSDLNCYNLDSCSFCKFKNVCLHCTDSTV